MAKHKMACPITGGACIECPIYRGRHYYLCFSLASKNSSLDQQRLRRLKTAEKSRNSDKTFGMPDRVEIGSQCIQDVEEVTIEKEFAAR